MGLSSRPGDQKTLIKNRVRQRGHGEREIEREGENGNKGEYMGVGRKGKGEIL